MRITKIIVISDTHGQIDHVIPRLKELNGDMILHLGDHSDDARKISEKIGQEIKMVKGNCDYFDDETDLDKIIEISGKKIFMTHGHKYKAKAGINNLFYKGKEMDADLVLFGHTHMPYVGEYENVKFFNPGSASIPRGGSRRSIGVIEINGGLDISIVNI